MYKLIAFFCISLFSATLYAEQYVSLNTRPDVQQAFALLSAEGKPQANVILIPGGKGKIKLNDDGGNADIGKGGNFLVRSRHYFAQQGFVVATIDAPSDRYDRDGMFYGFRTSDEHMQDLKGIAEFLKAKNGLPVWIVGTSRGTESTAAAGIHIGSVLNGIVLTASMTEGNDKGTSVPEMKINKITLPVLIVSHEDDACWVTPPSGAQVIKNSLSAAKTVEVKMFSGGDKPRSKPCKAKSYHGFLGIESQVVAYISNFIRQYSQP